MGYVGNYSGWRSFRRIDIDLYDEIEEEEKKDLGPDAMWREIRHEIADTLHQINRDDAGNLQITEFSFNGALVIPEMQRILEKLLCDAGYRVDMLQYDYLTGITKVIATKENKGNNNDRN